VAEVARKGSSKNKKDAGNRLPARTGYRTRGIHLMTHQAYAIARLYWSGMLSRRTVLGKFADECQDEYARDQGFDSFDDAPIALREKIRIAIRETLFQSLFEVSPSSKTGARDLRGSINTLSRTLSELGLTRKAKPISEGDLTDYLRQMDASKTVDLKGGVDA